MSESNCNVCDLNPPITNSNGVVGVNEFQLALRECKKQPTQIASVALQTLSSMGYLSNLDEESREKIKGYLCS